jgi:hypothetical protein
VKKIAQQLPVMPDAQTQAARPQINYKEASDYFQQNDVFLSA